MLDLATITNAARPIAIGGVTYRARTLTLGNFAEVLAWLDERLPKDEHGATPAFSSDEAQLALATTAGLGVLLHLCLLPCHPTLTRDEANALAASLDDAGMWGILWIAFRRRPDYKPDSGGKGISETDWGELFHFLHTLEGRGMTYPEIAGLTLDQLDNVLSMGKSEASTPQTADDSEWAPGRPMSRSEVQKMWAKVQAENEASTPSSEPLSDLDRRIADVIAHTTIEPDRPPNGTNTQ